MKRKADLLSIAVIALLGALAPAPGLFAGCPIMVLPNNNTNSMNARCPMTRYRYERTVYLITASELAANGLPNGAPLVGIGWNYHTAPGLEGSAPLVIYLQNTTDTSNLKSTTWATAIADMTAVHSATTTLPNVTGPFDITFSGGSPFTYTGGGLYVAFDWGAYAGTLSSTAVAYCNTALTSGILGAQSTVSAPTTLTASTFRPETRLTPNLASDTGVEQLYSMGVLPLDIVSGSVFQAVVSNYGASTVTNIQVMLDITGANTFSDTQNIASLAPCESATVSFCGFTPVALGSSTVTASVAAGDMNPDNDSKSKPLDVSANKTSYKYPGTTASGGLGITSNPIEILARFMSDAVTQVDSVTIEFPATNPSTYRVSIREDDGSGAPGTQLYLDAADRAITSTGSLTIVLPSPVAVGPGNFFVGLQKANAVYFLSLGCDTERPIRAGSFYYCSPLGNPFLDTSPAYAFKPNIGVTLGDCVVPGAACNVMPNGTTKNCPGSAITFTANAFGGTAPYLYQWTEDGSDVSGATNSTYSATQPSAGSFAYNCRITDAGGCHGVVDPTSSFGRWVVPPSVNVTPEGTTGVLIGSTIVFTASASGGTPPYLYQWTEDGSDIAGATNSTLSRTYASAQSHVYNCKMSSTGCATTAQDAAASTGAWLSILPPGEVISQNWTDKVTQSWSSVAGAEGYKLQRGQRTNLADLYTANWDSCNRYTGASTSLATLTEDPSLLDAGDFFWYLAIAYNGSGDGPSGSGTPGVRVVNNQGTCLLNVGERRRIL